MKRLIFLLILSTSATIDGHQSAQDCKYEINTIDEFTGVRKIMTYTAIITPSKQTKKELFTVSACFERFDTASFIRLSIITMKPIFIEKDQLLYLKFTDDSIIQLLSPTTNLKSDPSYDCYVINQRYPITKATLSRISNIGINKIRIETTDGYIDSEVSDTGNKFLHDFINCLNNAPDPDMIVPEVKKKVKRNFP